VWNCLENDNGCVEAEYYYNYKRGRVRINGNSTRERKLLNVGLRVLEKNLEKVPGCMHHLAARGLPTGTIIEKEKIAWL